MQCYDTTLSQKRLFRNSFLPIQFECDVFFFVFIWISRSWSSLFGIKKGGNSNNFSFSVPWMLQLFVAAMQYKQSQEALSFFRIIPFVQFPPSVILKFLPPWWSTRRELFLLGGVILNWLCSAAFGLTLYAVVVVYAFGNEMVTIYCCVYRLNHITTTAYFSQLDK